MGRVDIGDGNGAGRGRGWKAETLPCYMKQAEHLMVRDSACGLYLA